ncbi:Cytochrome c oxidase subunit 5B, mitochondrial [Malassezia pachydermatis]|uniref:Cytochrome c oxidase subunit v n=1 Tax=Malassezia pachydermatis TaxID=77020 RepID=A0A0M8MZ21_9BASI|nr:cytochrome c oxidase subunit v [Malassezia pachydermatis]KOS16401.1 cytochrome c oxidase subunit v [Malassezia pachydermatis]
MLGSVRVAVPRVIPRSAPLARSIATKGDRWTPAVARDAQQVLEGPNALELNKVLPNIEAMWPKMAREEQYSVYKLLEEVQRKDWKELTVDEKKGAYFVSYGLHGPRRPTTPPGQSTKVFIGTLFAVALGVTGFYAVRSIAAPAPKSLTKEYQEQMNERAKETKQNPITGIASEGYKGKGHVV